MTPREKDRETAESIVREIRKSSLTRHWTELIENALHATRISAMKEAAEVLLTRKLMN